jgi:hypothetical protein
LYNKTDSSLEGVSSHPYYPKKTGLEIGEEKIVEFSWAYWNVFGFNFKFKIPTSGGPMLRFLGAHVISSGWGRCGERNAKVKYDYFCAPIILGVNKYES